VGKGKPAPDLFLEISHRIKVFPSDILIVDDIVEGIRAGQSAGMISVGIFDEWYNNQIQLKTESDYYIIMLKELQSIVSDLL
jgi:beta-phosphoglucomutase-like phosphatase (HAD superfamily)